MVFMPMHFEDVHINTKQQSSKLFMLTVCEYFQNKTINVV